VPSSRENQLQVTVLIVMPDVRRRHADAMGFSGHSKGKAKSLDWDYDEDDFPEMALGTTELHYNDTLGNTKPL
jgi:hypothetical protein